MFRCEYCNSTFGLKATLLAHQKNAKYCITIQKSLNVSVIMTEFKCNFCSKISTRRNDNTKHEQVCKGNIKNIYKSIIEKNRKPNRKRGIKIRNEGDESDYENNYSDTERRNDDDEEPENNSDGENSDDMREKQADRCYLDIKKLTKDNTTFKKKIMAAS